ncbi:MAG: class I SAM-dependent methyltransferase [Planctomycetota bacterium]|nr:class I SAM-dependent methyltransferase [Planctomycetota bacterium]
MDDSGERTPYRRTAAWYDAIYRARGRDCAREVASISRHWIDDGRSPETRRVLELGCGTGAHGPGLSGHGALTGVDRSPSMLEQARRTGCYQHLLEADVLALPRDRGYELVTSLFGVFGYLEHPAQLHSALHDAGRLLVPGGTLLVEPPILAERLQPPRVDHVETAFEGGTLARTARARTEPGVLVIEFEWTLAPGPGSHSPTDPVRVIEEHRMLLLPSTEWLGIARSALGPGFEVVLDEDGPLGRGLLVAFNRDGAVDTG